MTAAGLYESAQGLFRRDVAAHSVDNSIQQRQPQKLLFARGFVSQQVADCAAQGLLFACALRGDCGAVHLAAHEVNDGSDIWVHFVEYL
nr:hypothetical protein [Rhodoferax sp.]